ncbi:GroES family chaperonin [Aspergillus clavatus NRRL 1]|uniref:Chaperonin, putative n=1 Tax=Aspergillus clavatus (strain ATCC 1007 / CBS 513.65 / DSM 816 / NCTC 3887 / NRRL 1 / QM 1276 / 107) TaxID=344612 RepID=A1CTW1_ASPCL|nr:chaperonin, putative [Aspergillus clavatus NRRL 1]EAW06748.1 chaperonin, putative [Aspergillus clavatus NRRL 1]
MTNFSHRLSSILRNIKSLAPLLDRVLVQRIKPEAKTASGIFLPESSVKEQNEAKVLAVGPGAVDRNGQRIPMSVAAGDKVLIPQFGGSPIKVGEEEYTLYRDSEYVFPSSSRPRIRGPILTLSPGSLPRSTNK